MTREKMTEIECKLYEAVRAKWGYGDEGDEIVDGLSEAMDAWFDAKEGAGIKVKVKGQHGIRAEVSDVRSGARHGLEQRAESAVVRVQGQGNADSRSVPRVEQGRA